MAVNVGDLFARLFLRPDKRSFDVADKLLGKIRTAVLGVGAFAAVRGLKSMVDDTVALGSKLVEASAKTGETIENLQQLGYAAQQSGSSFEGMQAGLTAIGRSMYSASQGSKKQKQAFRDMGVAFEDANGKLRPAADVFQDIADRFASLPNGAEKLGLAKALRIPPELIPTLNEGSEGIAKLRQEFIELGGQMDGDTARSLESFGDEQAALGVAWVGLRNEAVAQLLPALRELVGGLTSWIKANRQLLAQRLATLLKLLVSGLKLVGAVLGVVLDVLGLLLDNLDLVTMAVLGLTGALMILRAGSIAAAVASGAAWAASMLPILLLAAAVTGVALLFEDLYSWMTGGESVLKDLWNEGLDGLIARVEGFIGDVRDSIEGFVDYVKNLDAEEAIKDFFFGGDEVVAEDGSMGNFGGGGLTPEEVAALQAGGAGAFGSNAFNKGGLEFETGMMTDDQLSGGELAKRKGYEGAVDYLMEQNNLTRQQAAKLIASDNTNAVAGDSYVGKQNAAAAALFGPMPEPENMSRVGGSGQAVDLSNLSITVSSTSSDPLEVARQVRKTAEQLLNDKIREAISW